MRRLIFWAFGLALAWLLLRDEPAFQSLLFRLEWGWELMQIAIEEKMND